VLQRKSQVKHPDWALYISNAGIYLIGMHIAFKLHKGLIA